MRAAFPGRGSEKHMSSASLKPGIYQHYKGKQYRVLGTAKHSETLEEMVVYEPLYENPIAKLWVRPLEMFLEEVEVEGIRKKRFKLIK
jgi:hypothetical protein